MGKHIHSRIFLLVLLVILSMTTGIGIAFSASSAWYVQSMSKRDADHILSFAEAAAKTFPETDLHSASPEKVRAMSKELLQKTKDAIKTEAIHGKLLVFNSKYDLVYPEAYEANEISDELTAACVQILKNKPETALQDQNVQTAQGNWLLSFFTMNTDYSVRGKYYVAAVPVQDLTPFLEYMQHWFWILLLAAASITSLFAWLISKSISSPLQKLCRQILLTGDGQSAQIQEHYSLAELETLKNSYNQMEQRIRNSEEEKNRFFQNVSHDLKTPLASITGYAQGISCGVIEDYQKASEIILSESLRMTSLVESILSLTKMDNRELTLTMMDIDLVELIEECLDALQGISTDCSLTLINSPEELEIRTDPELLKRILENLLSNSLRYAGHSITVSLKTETDMVLILAEDDGPGFDEADLPHVFERFYKGNRGKTGIGLSFVWSAVHYLEGTIEVGNRKSPDSGAVYRLRLPL